jgi:hypothetical protein
MQNTKALLTVTDDELEAIDTHIKTAYRPPVEPEDGVDLDDPDADIDEGTAWVDVTFRFIDGRRVIVVESSDGYKSGPIY